MRNFKAKMKRAFTITELVIVIAVIAILAAVLIPTFSNVISTARESAAMQECRNALTDYNGQVAATEGTAPVGMTFVNNGYAYVNLNGNLHLAGKTSDLARISAQSFENKKDFTKKVEGKVTGLDTAKGHFTNVFIMITSETGARSEQEIDLTAKETATEDTVAHIGENLYFYTLNDNNTDYVGYFTLEEGKEPKLELNGTYYSRMFGFTAMTTNGGNMKVDTESNLNCEHTNVTWTVNGNEHEKICQKCNSVLDTHTPELENASDWTKNTNGNSSNKPHLADCTHEDCDIVTEQDHSWSDYWMCDATTGKSYRECIAKDCEVRHEEHEYQGDNETCEKCGGEKDEDDSEDKKHKVSED